MLLTFLELYFGLEEDYSLAFGGEGGCFLLDEDGRRKRMGGEGNDRTGLEGEGCLLRIMVWGGALFGFSLFV